MIWVEMVNKSLLRLMFVEYLYKYTAKDKKYIIVAITITTKRFGPSGSLKNMNITLEHVIDVMPKINNEIFFDLEYIFVSILENFSS